MEPEVIQTFHIYPNGCDNLYRTTIASELTDPNLLGFDGITIQAEDRASEDVPFTDRWTLSLDIQEAKAFHDCLGKVIASKEAIVRVEASEG
jgi:hypothetical protein